jgi:anti-sigma regulatory factor (Ser/Thr protein kinase)
VATQSGSYLLNASGNKIIKEFTAANQNKSSKAACIFNDSILILGTHALAYLYNINTFTAIDSILKRVVSLGKDNDGKIYIGSNEGLFRWDKDSLHNFGKVSKALAYKVNSICCTPENLLFVGIGSDSLVVMKEGKLIQSIPLGNSIPGSLCKSLFCNKAGEVWLGTNKGLNKINYTFANNQFTYSNTFFGLADGLAGDEVNDITVANDTVYAATNGGISFFPEKLKLPVADIATFITGISINGKAVSVQDEYSLSYDKNDITIEFSGVDLTGYSPFFEAKINNGLWQRLDKNSIDLKKLAQGNSIIEIRAILRNGLPSPQTARVKIYIRTPFWQSSIFWSLLALAVFIAIIYLLQRRNREKQKQAIEKISTEKRFTELEMQALKAQINPHFVFNCLNSIKGFIYEKDYAQADKYLDKFSALMRSTVDNSDAAIISLMDEINYLDNYLQLEKLRFEDKFEYVINAAGVTDTKNVFVPAMLMQPYVENAIRHGVRFLENKKGKIAITATEEGGQLVCSIEDNGIGRQKATELKSRSHIEYQSRGMSISKRRAELYNITQEIIDKKDEAGNAAGTKIILRIPLELKQ